MRLLCSCSLLVFALCAFAGEAQAGRPEPRLCEHITLLSHRTDRQSADPLRKAALELAQRLLRLDTAVEHGALLYRTAQGTIRIGEITVGDMHAVQLTVDPRRGETVAAALHTHAHYAYHSGDQSLLSHGDVILGERLLALAQTDRALRLYIVDTGQATVTEYVAGGRCPSGTSHLR